MPPVLRTAAGERFPSSWRLANSDCTLQPAEVCREKVNTEDDESYAGPQHPGHVFRCAFGWGTFFRIVSVRFVLERSDGRDCGTLSDFELRRLQGWSGLGARGGDICGRARICVPRRWTGDAGLEQCRSNLALLRHRDRKGSFVTSKANHLGFDAGR